MICVTGADGAGKTTQLGRLAERLERVEQRKVACVTIWDLLLDPDTSPKVGLRSPRQVDTFLRILEPMARALYLFSSFRAALDRALAQSPDVLLLNSYWYKYYATEVAHGGAAEPMLRIAEAAFPEPDTTFYLRLTPAQAFGRKADLSGYETGFAEPRSEEAFLAFQTRAHAALDQQAERRGWFPIDAARPPAETTEAILERIKGA